MKAAKKMDKMTKTTKNNILMIAYQQGKIFKKFKANNKFTSAVTAFKISKTTINFKIGIVKFIDMYPKMRTSCISLYYLKNNFKVTKEVCKNMLLNFNNIFLTNIFDYSEVKKRAVLVYCKTKV